MTEQHNSPAGRAYMPVSISTDWATPKKLFDDLDAEFGPFTLDPCGSREHHYSAFRVVSNGGHFYDGTTEAMDGLTQPWDGVVFMNPPYGRGVEKWIERGVSMVETGVARRVLGLVKATTDVRWWQKYVLNEWGSMNFETDAHADSIIGHPALRVCRFLPGRVKFGHNSGPAPFPSAVLVWEKP